MKKTTKARLIFTLVAAIIVAGIAIAVEAVVSQASAQSALTAPTETTMTAGTTTPAEPAEPAELMAGKAHYDKRVNPEPLTAAPVKGEKILKRTGYTCSYDPQKRQPNYVAWTLTAPRTYGQNRREPQFYEDLQIAADQRAMLSDYYNSGMSRGHMCPAADNKWNDQAMRESFLLSNVCPQTITLNGEDWEQLESFCRSYVRHFHATLSIICGPVYTSTPPQLRRKRLYVPDRFFKAIVRIDKGAERGIAFIYDNNSEQHPMRYYVRSIDQVEKITGLDLFHSLPTKLQERLEAQADLKDWRW